MCPGCGWCGLGDPAPAPQRACLRAGVARCGGGGRASPGGVPLVVVRGSEGRRSPSPGCQSSGRAVEVRYPRAVGAGVPRWGPSTFPLACMPCWGLRAERVVGGVWVQAPSLPAASPLGGLPGLAGHVLWPQVWVCAVCVVSVRCVPWCLVLPFVCPPDAPLSGALLWCCARRVLAVPPSLRVSLAQLLGTSSFFHGFVALYPFLYSLSARPPPWRALFPCLRPGVCLGVAPCLRGACCVACAVSWASWLLFTGVLCACSVCCVLCAVSWATWLLFTVGMFCVVCGVCGVGEGVGVCSRVPYRPRSIFCRAQE